MRRIHLRKLYKRDAFIDGFFSILFQMPKASTLEESRKRINKALNVYRIIKKRELWDKLTQEHLDRTVAIALTKKDEEEFEREWGKVKAV